MKSRKQIKDKALIIYQALFGGRSKFLWIMAITGGLTVAYIRETSISNILEDNLCKEIFFDAALENSKHRLDKGLITKEQIEKITKELERKRELDDYELTFYDNYLVSCKRSIENKSKEGFWKTFIVISSFSWIGLYFTNRFPK